MPTNPPSSTSVGVGAFARGALRGSFWWYVGGVLTCVLVPWVCLIWSLIAMIQMRKAREGMPGFTRALLGLFVFTGAATCHLVINYAG